MMFQEMKAAVDMATELASYLRQKANHDPELDERFLRLRSAVLEMYADNTRLQAELFALKASADVKASVAYDRELFAYFNKADLERQEPFCQVCLDNENKKIRMVERGFFWTCGVCKHAVYARGGREKHEAHNAELARRKKEQMANIGTRVPWRVI